MKKFLYTLSAITVVILIVLGNTLGEQGFFSQPVKADPTLITEWGSIGGRTGGWKVNVGEAGTAGISGDTVPVGGWATIRGGFAALTAAEDQAVVVKGVIEFIGAGPQTWSGLRYGLFRHDSISALVNAGTDSAKWEGRENYAYGYMITPPSGTLDPVSWANGGNGTHGLINGGSWISTNGAGGSMGVFRQKPARAEFDAGKYDFAISVRPIGTGVNELKYYIVKQHAEGTQATYWLAGTDVDSSGIGSSFNGIAFGLNPGNGAETSNIRGLNLSNVTSEVGDPITIPEPPFTSFYVSQWGQLGGRTGGWHVVPGEFDGNVGIAGDTVPTGNWATIRGGFDDDVTATVNKAIVVTGKVEFIGAGPQTWSGLRYGLFRHDSVGTITGANTDTAKWSGLERYAYGYMITPHSGTTDAVSWANGGFGTHGVINGGSWISTNGAGGSMGVVNQKPARAEFDAGVYDWAISVQPQSDGTNELRFFMIKEAEAGQQTTYWIATKDIDSSGVTATFNGVAFGLDNNYGPDYPISAMNLMDVKVDMGDPIEIPDPPFNSFYVSQWGSLGGDTGGWKFVPGEFDGNAGVAGDTVPVGTWASIRGGFDDDVTATLEKAIVVTGSIEFVGAGPQTWSGLRYGLFRHDSAGTVINAGLDSAKWSPGKSNSAYGYMITPHSGTNDQVTWAAGQGSHGAINGGRWFSTYGAGGVMGLFNQAPVRAEMTAGKYNWGISVRPLADGSNELKFFIEKDHAAGVQTEYWFAGTDIDTIGVTTTFNGVAFALDNNYGPDYPISAMNLSDVKVDLGDPVEIPEKPFNSFYISQWGSLGGDTGGWKYVPGEFDGNGGIAGDTVPVGTWATIRGGFDDDVEAKTDKAVVVTGVIEFVGSGPQTWSGLRYGIFRHDSAGTVINANTDSAKWSPGKSNSAYGYMITPHSGTNDQVTWAAGQGSHGAINGGRWFSTYGAGGVMGLFNQKPVRAEMTAGKYDWAISVHPLADGSNELRFYIQKQHAAGVQTEYWFAGIDIDTIGVTTTFNGIAFGLDNNYGPDYPISGMYLSDVKVDRVDPILIPTPPFVDFYVADWGFLNDKVNGWTLTPGEFDGNVDIAGSALTSGVELRGQFDDLVDLREDTSIVIKGKMELVGGGFEAANSLLMGLFYSDSAKTLDTLNEWTGNGYGSGYLFIPTSGTNAVPLWGQTAGTFGGVVNSNWSNYATGTTYVLSANQQQDKAVGAAGTYDFEFSLTPTDNGTEVRYYIYNSAYAFGGIVTDNNTSAITQFNSINFALSNSTTTALKLTDVHVGLGSPVAIPDDVVGVKTQTGIPTAYALNQNYPNPFNPTTTIEFALPKSGNVTLIVYDALGRKVTELVQGTYNAGYYKINFNAANYASGVYFYRITAGDFVSVKKLMLLK